MPTVKPPTPRRTASPKAVQASFDALKHLDEADDLAPEAMQQRWLLPYADMMTSLFGVVLVVGLAWAAQQQQAFVAKETALTQQVSQTQAALASTTAKLDTLQTQLEAWQKEQAGLTFKRNAQGITLTLDEKLLFDAGQAQLPASAQPVLQHLATVLAQSKGNIRVEGHTDASPIATPQYPSNWELSAARAVALVRWLAEEGKLDPTRLSATAYAHFRPVANNSTVEGKQSNRRVAILIEGDATSPVSSSQPQPKAPPHHDGSTRQTQSP